MQINPRNSTEWETADRDLERRRGPASLDAPEVGAAGEDEAVEVVGGAHGVDGNVGEGAGVEALDLDVLAQGGEVTVEAAELAAAPLAVGGLRRWRRIGRHLRVGPVGSGLRVGGIHF